LRNLIARRAGDQRLKRSKPRVRHDFSHAESQHQSSKPESTAVRVTFGRGSFTLGAVRPAESIKQATCLPSFVIEGSGINARNDHQGPFPVEYRPLLKTSEPMKQ
jgi:hypothetical protein